MYGVICENEDGGVTIECNPPFENPASADIWISKCKKHFPEYTYRVAMIRNGSPVSGIFNVPEMEAIQ